MLYIHVIILSCSGGSVQLTSELPELLAFATSFIFTQFFRPLSWLLVRVVHVCSNVCTCETCEAVKLMWFSFSLSFTLCFFYTNCVLSCYEFCFQQCICALSALEVWIKLALYHCPEHLHFKQKSKFMYIVLLKVMPTFLGFVLIFSLSPCSLVIILYLHEYEYSGSTVILFNFNVLLVDSYHKDFVTSCSILVKWRVLVIIYKSLISSCLSCLSLLYLYFVWQHIMSV